MAQMLASPWTVFVQALLGILGTYLLAFGLKSVREAGGLDTSDPHPASCRMWAGLVLLTLSLLPPLMAPFVR